MNSFIDAMPKAELHVHLEGTLEPDLRFALARKHGIHLPYPTAEDMLRAYDFHDLPSFLAIYYSAMDVLQEEADFFELAWRYLLKAREQNIVYAEMFFDPQAHTSRGIPFQSIIRGIRGAQERAQADLGVQSQLIMCFLRDMSADFAEQTLADALPYKHWIVGVGLDSDEKDNPPRKFAQVFAKARVAGFKLTMHCDVNQLNTLEHIRQVLDEIGVDRIDHGVNSVQDPALCALIARRGLGLTVCPISNRFCVQDLTAQQIRTMLELGMRATVNSDDPAYFRAYLNENLQALHEEGGLSREEIARLVRNAFEVAWLEDEQRGPYLQALTEYCRSTP